MIMFVEKVYIPSFSHTYITQKDTYTSYKYVNIYK